jgi:hypothetical protein
VICAVGLNAEQIKGKLRLLGMRRVSLERMEEELSQETAVALVEARRNRVRMTDAARLLGLSRSTVYERWGDDIRGDDDGVGEAEGTA